MNTKASRNAVVACASANWIPPAAVTLLSCAEQGITGPDELKLVILDPKPEDVKNLQRFNERHGIAIDLIPVEAGDLRDVSKHHRLGLGALLRLKLDIFLPNDLNRVLYLDSDILALSDLTDAFNLDFQGHPFAAVQDIGRLDWVNSTVKSHTSSNEVGINAPYFNSGVMLFDWQKIRASDFLPRCLELRKSRSDWRFQDQDVLNIVSQGDWKQLPLRWNVTKKVADYLDVKPVLRHFTGREKPWNCRGRIGFAPFFDYYHNVLDGTAWEAFMHGPQLPVLKSNWMTVTRKLSFLKKARLRKRFGGV